MKQFLLLLVLLLGALFLIDRALYPDSGDDGLSADMLPWQGPSTTRTAPPTDLSPCGFGCSQTESGFYWAQREQDRVSSENDCDMGGYNAASGDFASGCKAYLRGDTKPPSSDITPGWHSEVH